MDRHMRNVLLDALHEMEEWLEDDRNLSIKPGARLRDWEAVLDARKIFIAGLIKKVETA